MDVADLARVLASGAPGPTIVCLQAGNVNTGACDDLRTATELVHRHGGWVHVDGAFGAWAAASPRTRHLVDGIELADSWACDAHKWLNVPYDSAFAIVSRPDVHAAAMSYTAAYLTGAGSGASGADFTAESSRRARGFAVWAALRELGRDGVAELVDRCCALARRFADGLRLGRFRGGQRGRAQPGAGRLRRRTSRARTARCVEGGPAGRHMLARCDDLAGAPPHAGLGVQPPDRPSPMWTAASPPSPGSRRALG